MLSAFLDASALGKRFLPEVGTPVLNHLFARMPSGRLVVLNVGVAEVLSILVRGRNGGRLTPAAFSQTRKTFLAQIVRPTLPRKLPTSNRLVNAALALIPKHSIN